MSTASIKILKKRRSVAVLLIFVTLIGFSFMSVKNPEMQSNDTAVLSESVATEKAIDVLDTLEVKGRAQKTGYARDQFSSGWATIDGCDMRNRVLLRDMTDVKLADDNCTVLSGTLQDPYTGETIEFTRGSSSSADVQIDHVVALSDSWQKGAQVLDETQRLLFANDPLNLLAVDGPANQQKGDSDAASWLPAHKNYRCRYVARQIAVKAAYSLWVSAAEKAAMKRVLNGCGEQRLPVEEYTTS